MLETHQIYQCATTIHSEGTLYAETHTQSWSKSQRLKLDKSINARLPSMQEELFMLTLTRIVYQTLAAGWL